MNNSTINREASDKTKGFRLQKLRAANLALEEVEKGTLSRFYIAIEQDGDVAKIDACAAKDSEYYEEDKHYPGTKFTINSRPIKNTLVIFFDVHIDRWRESKDICFGFYTTAGVGKEKKTDLSEALGITFPDENILDLLREEDIEGSVVELVKKFLIAEYEQQYRDRKSSGNLEILKSYDINLFKDFLQRIRWFFGEEDNDELKEVALIKIRKCQYFNYRLEGMESYILSEIMEQIEARQDEDNFSERFIDRSQMEVIFLKMQSFDGVHKQQDVAWTGWDAMKVADDTRNLREKIHAVCSSFSEKEIARLTRRACIAKSEEKAASKDYLSLRYRILEACEEIIHDQIWCGELSPERISNILEVLKDKAANSIGELKVDFNYPVQNSHSIKSIVIDLFDSCYLSFDDL